MKNTTPLEKEEQMDILINSCYNNIDHDNTKSLIRAIKPSCISSWLYKGLLIWENHDNE